MKNTDYLLRHASIGRLASINRILTVVAILGCVIVGRPVWAQSAPPMQGAAAKAQNPASKEAGELPPGYKPPASIPEMMLLDKPIETLERLDELKKKLSLYKERLRGTARGDVSDADKKIIREGIHYRLALLTLKENRDKRELVKLRDEFILTDLPQVGRLVDRGDNAREFRRFYMQEVANQAAQLFDNNFYVRLQAIVILENLDLTELDSRRGLKQEAFSPAIDPLVKFLNDPDQHDALKVRAAGAIERLARFGVPEARRKLDAGKALVSELMRSGTETWYQRRLASVIAAIDSPIDGERKPYLHTALMTVMSDVNRPWEVRAECAFSLGRLTYDANGDPKQAVKAVSLLAVEMAQAYSKKRDADYWQDCFWRLYLAFQAEDGNDRDAERKNKGGFLNRPQLFTTAGDSYKAILPLVNAALTKVEVPKGAIEKVAAIVGIKESGPADDRESVAQPQQ